MRITQSLRKINTGTLKKNATKKIKTFRGNKKSHTNETLRKAIMKRWQLKNKENKTLNVADGSNYKKQRNYIVELCNHSKKDHFDRVKAEKSQNHSGKVVNCTFQINILLENRKLH